MEVLYIGIYIYMENKGKRMKQPASTENRGMAGTHRYVNTGVHRAFYSSDQGIHVNFPAESNQKHGCSK